MKKYAIAFIIFASSLTAQVQLGKNVQIGSGAGTVLEVDTNTTSGISGGPITTTGTVACSQSTSSQFGCVKPDGTTITATGGVISAIPNANWSMQVNGSPATQFVVVRPSGGVASCASGTVCDVNASSALINWQCTGVLCNTQPDTTADWVFTGSVLPAGVSAGSVTNVYAYSINQGYSPVSNPVASTFTCNGQGVHPAGNTWSQTQTTTGALAGITGSNFTGVTCHADIIAGGAPGPSGTTLSIPDIGLIIQYTGTPATTPPAIYVQTPLWYNPSITTLGIDTSSLGTTVSVNGTAVSNPNLNGTTPAAGTNGKNIAFQSSGSSVSGELVGDGNAAHYLDGTGNYTAPGGSGPGNATYITADGTGTPPANYQALTAGSNITLTPNAGAHTMTVAATGGTPLVSRVNVLSYGAVADGNLAANTGTDNTTAFTNCLTAAIAAKDVCYVPAGVYRIAGAMPNITTGGTGFVGDVWGFSSSVTNGTWPAPITQIFTSSNSATILTVTGGAGVIAGNSVKNIAWQRAVAPLTGAIGLLFSNTPGITVSGNTVGDSSIGMDITYAPTYGGGEGFSDNYVSFCYTSIGIGAGPNIGFNLHGGLNGFQSMVVNRNVVANNCGSGVTSYGFKADGAIVDLEADKNETSGTSYGVYFVGSGGQDVHLLNQVDDTNTTNCEYFDYSGQGVSTNLTGGWCDASHATAGGTILHNVRGVKVSERMYFDSGLILPDGVTLNTSSTGNSVVSNTFYQPNSRGIVCNGANGNNFSGNTFNLVSNSSEAMDLTNCSKNVIIANKAISGTSTVISLDASSNNNTWTDMNSWDSSGTAVSDAGSGNNYAASLPSQYRTWSCQPGLGDGLNAIAAGTYLSSTCRNTTGVTVTLTGLQCFTDNAGTSTMNAAGNTLGALLTGAVTCSTSFAAGTQSANVALTNGDYIKFTFVADGTSKQTTWVVTGTY